ncbi:MAG: hypothetical protein Phyf2KO_02230 [Phycisphaerales bacterium]
MTVLGRNKLTIGVDIGSETLRAVAIRRDGTKCEVVAAVESVRTPNHPVPTAIDVQRLSQALERQGVIAKEFVVGAPPERLMASMLELPPRSSGAPIESLAQAEIAKSLPGSFESCIMDLPESARQKTTEYFALAFSHEAASDLLSPFESEGIRVAAIEPDVTALSRVTGANNRVVLDVGKRGARLYAYEGKNTLFARCTPHAEGKSDPSSIVSGFVGTIDYLVNRFQGLEDATLIVLGQPNLYERVKAVLLDEFDADITNNLVVDLASSGAVRGCTFDSRWASAIGLATRTSEKEAA